jgi:hypothetical protein
VVETFRAWVSGDHEMAHLLLLSANVHQIQDNERNKCLRSSPFYLCVYAKPIRQPSWRRAPRNGARESVSVLPFHRLPVTSGFKPFPTWCDTGAERIGLPAATRSRLLPSNLST